MKLYFIFQSKFVVIQYLARMFCVGVLDVRGSVGLNKRNMDPRKMKALQQRP